MPVLLALVFLAACIPPAPKYPNESQQKILSEAQQLSDSLEAYVKLWLDGKADSRIPDRLIPKGIVDNKNFYLKKPEEVSSRETWGYRLSHPVNFDSMLNGLPDPHVTYLLLGPSLAPFGSKLVIEGEFPYCRFFSIQVSAPLDGRTYTATRYFGAAEVSIADADIEPLPGNSNPFRPGADRLSANRKYRMEFKLVKGDAVALNEGLFTPPYRKQTNTAAGSLIVYQGPWGEKDFFGNKKPDGGKWDVGNVWIRIYAPDKNKDAWGGVPMPKVYYELPDGRKYFIGADFSELLKRANGTMKARITNTAPNPNIKVSDGWYKSFGIVRSILNGASLANGWNRMENAPKINAVDLGVTGRGENQAPPGNYEPHATTNNYATYLGRALTVQKGMVAVLVGKLPTTPLTRSGDQYMQKAQLRYWSICGYDNSLDAKLPGSAVNGIMDEDMMLDKDRNYILVYSRKEDRPSNAKGENGITWVNWGPTAELGLMMRYVSIANDWDFDKSPNEKRLPWPVADWAGSRYDSTLIGLNHHKGFMQCYIPRIVVMTKKQFEMLGASLRAADIPSWVDKTNQTGINEAYRKPITVSSVWKNDKRYIAERMIDGDLNTRWASNNLPATVQVDLGEQQHISAIKLFWESAAAREYSIAVSSDGNNWKEFYSTNRGNGGIDVISFLRENGRFVRLTIKKGTWLPWVSLFEMEVLSNKMPCDPIPGSAFVSPTADQNLLSVYPNPVISEALIKPLKADWADKIVELQIYSSGGKLVHAVSQKGNSIRLNCSNWPAGIYFANLFADRKRYQSYFVKQ